jgi:hypothetical protein
MPLLAIKIGQNEPDLYAKTNQLGKHLDIVDCPADETLTSVGKMGDKEYLAIKFSWPVGITSSEISAFRWELKRPWLSWMTDIVPLTRGQLSAIVKPQTRMIAKRHYYLDLAAIPTFTSAQKTKIAQLQPLKENKLPFDVAAEGLSNITVTVPWNTLKNYIKNKYTHKTIGAELAAQGY